MNKEQEELIVRAFSHIEDLFENREPTYTMVMDAEHLEPELREKVGDKVADAFNLAINAIDNHLHPHHSTT
jgi:hypothetical protein